jgi:hypothetical protein
MICQALKRAASTERRSGSGTADTPMRESFTAYRITRGILTFTLFYAFFVAKVSSVDQ